MLNERFVYIIDDDEAVRRSVSFLLKHAGYQTISLETGEAFLKEYKNNPRGCVLLDIAMPGMDGLEVQQEMIREGIDMPVIILTGHGDVELAVRAMRAGAVSFIEKPYDKEDLLTALDEGFERIENSDRKQMASAEAKVRLACLTGRERDVLDGLMAGYPNKTIAYDLGISPRTVEIYRANMMEKLRVRSLAEALRIGFSAEEPGKVIAKPVQS